MPIVRLQKALAHAGIASRRAAEALITSGRIRVDGQVVTELGTRVDPRKSRVEVDGRRVIAESHVYVVLHKPRSVVSTMNDPEGRPTVRELFTDVPGRVYPVGRLDFATSGVLFATNDGDFAEGLMHPRRAVPKTYVLKVQGEMQPKDVDLWRHGIELEDGKTLPAKVKLLRHEAKKTWLELTITEGRNQQVRRMGDASGFRVMRLARTAFAGVTSEGLRPGQWRYLTVDELTTLKADFGVPKRAVSPPRAPPPRESPKRVAPQGRESPKRAALSDREPSDREPSRHGTRPARASANRGAPRGRSSSRRGAVPEREPSRRGAAPERSSSRRGAAPEREASRRGAAPDRAPSTSRPPHVERGPRYGGGAPGRRDADVREHWGGGIRRGSSGARDDERGRPDAEREGRGGGTRTTGTGGGIGAEPGGNYRVRGRRP